jgi:LysM repeat protein
MGSHAQPTRPFKLRRTGRHTQPSAVTTAATRAAPAAIIVGALVAGAPQAHAATSAAVATGARHPDHHHARHHPRAARHARHTQADAARYWTVRPGDTLSRIAGEVYGNEADWTWIFNANRQIADPNVIFVGQVLRLPDGPGQPRGGSPAVEVTSDTYLSGTLGCRGLEELWEAAGGARWAAFTAAEVATAESGGRQYAYSPTNDIGYWQIHDTWGPRLATFNPLGNARAAVYISHDGTDWEPWTTYRDGAYRGQC